MEKPTIEKKYVGEDIWQSIPYEKALEDLRGYYTSPENVLAELVANTDYWAKWHLGTNEPKIRTMFAYYRIAQS